MQVAEKAGECVYLTAAELGARLSRNAGVTYTEYNEEDYEHEYYYDSEEEEDDDEEEEEQKELNRSDYLTALSYLYLRDGKSGASTVASDQRKARLETEYRENWISLIPLASDPEV